MHHVALNCKDLGRQEAFYTRHFGFRRVRVHNAGRPDEFVMLQLGATCLELFSAMGEAKTQSSGEQAVGFKHLAFEVPDLDAALADLHSGGIETEEIIDCSPIVLGLRICFCHDPDGNRLELMQQPGDQFEE
jgi:glyoxylase I family protein